MLAPFLLTAVAVSPPLKGESWGRVEQLSPTHCRCAVQGRSDQDRRNRTFRPQRRSEESVPRCIVEAMYLINFALLRAHGICGVTL